MLALDGKSMRGSLRGDAIGLDYRRLFWDLTAWESPSERDRVALRWARDYFNTFTQAKEEPVR